MPIGDAGPRARVVDGASACGRAAEEARRRVPRATSHVPSSPPPRARRPSVWREWCASRISNENNARIVSTI